MAKAGEKAGQGAKTSTSCQCLERGEIADLEDGFMCGTCQGKKGRMPKPRANFKGLPYNPPNHLFKKGKATRDLYGNYRNR